MLPKIKYKSQGIINSPEENFNCFHFAKDFKFLSYPERVNLKGLTVSNDLTFFHEHIWNHIEVFHMASKF